MKGAFRSSLGYRFLSHALSCAAVLFAFASCGVGDQFCTVDSNPADKNDDCPYGPPGGPKPPAGDCPDIMPGDPFDCMNDPKDWVHDVYPIFNDLSRAACTDGGCHGKSPGARGVFLPPDDAKTSLESLNKYQGVQKYPYVNSGNTAHSWILCNLRDPPGVGSVMPTGGYELSDADYAIVEQWARCGMVEDKGGGTGGAGGGP